MPRVGHRHLELYSAGRGPAAAPQLSASDEARNARVEEAIAAHRHLPGALLPILHAIQDALGYVPPEAIPRIAQGLNLSRADVHGVISFYHDFRSTAPGRHVLRICRAEACQAMGSEALETHLKRRLEIEFHGTTADGAITLEAVYCLGNCALSPAIMVDGRIHGRLTPERLDEIVASLAESL